MRTVQAAETSVSILFSGEKPPAGGRMLELVRSALAEAGLQPWEETEADCFRFGEDTLLLARPGPGVRYFGFDDMDGLLAGVSGCTGDKGILYRMGTEFVLAIPPSSMGPGIYEFGHRLDLSPAWEVHAREQELCLIRERAMGVLRRGHSTGGS